MVNPFNLIESQGHEQVVYCHDPSCGYRGIIAIHDTTLGPALGGTRLWNYASETEALVDVLRLSRGMTYKAAVAGLNLGGGKAVIIGDPHTVRREALFRAHGRFIESLGGRYITAEDVGTSETDMEYVRMETRHVTGLPGASGDPSPVTAFGVFRGIQACVREVFEVDSLQGRTVAVQGLGHVGYHLCSYLHDAGAELIVSDLDPSRVQRVVEEFGARSVGVDEIFSVEADVYSPCALGATVNDETLPRLRARIVAGGANNVLAEPRHGDELHEREILYAPDYVINAGGLISVYGELQGWTHERAMRQAGEIYTTLLRLFERSREDSVPPHEAADRLARERIEAIGGLRRMKL
ncbi:MAG TPA: Glu/Leu/Phe/Val dehydrogenase dimerization domain-containing protein [Longimicrobiaceae bacterium]